jgi:hypothetical protein
MLVDNIKTKGDTEHLGERALKACTPTIIFTRPKAHTGLVGTSTIGILSERFYKSFNRFFL